jgi:hypothetical protein
MSGFGYLPFRNNLRKLGGRVVEIRGPEIVGERYRPACGRCVEPPWDACACSPLLECDLSHTERYESVTKALASVTR